MSKYPHMIEPWNNLRCIECGMPAADTCFYCLRCVRIKRKAEKSTAAQADEKKDV